MTKSEKEQEKKVHRAQWKQDQRNVESFTRRNGLETVAKSWMEI